MPVKEETVPEKKYGLYVTLIFFINFAVFMGRFSYGTVIKDIERSFLAAGFANAADEASLATTYLFLTYAVGQMLYTFVSKKISPKHVVFYSIVAVTVFTFGVAVLPLTYAKWLWAVNGLFHAVLYVSSMGVLSSFLPKEELTKAGSAMSAVMPTAQLALYVFAALFAGVADWRWLFYVSSFLMAVAAVAWFFLYRALEKLPKITEQDGGIAVRVRKPTAAYFVLLSSFCFTALICVGAKHIVSDWTPKIFESEYGIDASYSYLLVGIMMTASALSVGITKILVRWQENFCLLNIYQLILLAGLSLLIAFVQMPFVPFFIILVCMSSLAFSITNVAAGFAPFAYREYLSADVSGGWVNAVSCFGASLASLLAGRFMGQNDFATLYVVLAAAAALTCIPMAIGAFAHRKLKDSE